MPALTLYEICLVNVLETSCLSPISCTQLPISCLRDMLPNLSPYELERLDLVYRQRRIRTNDLWRHHFELIWSLSRDDKDSYESLFDIPYKRLYFEYLFHDTQILQLGIYTYISEINKSKSIINLSFVEQLKYNLTRDSVIYCSKKRLADDQQNLGIIWNRRWNKYIKRFILVPNVWNLAKVDPLLFECFTENVTDIVLSGYPTENDYHGMKFILEALTRGHITNFVLKFPSYCLINILSPLLIYPRSYSLSYLSTSNENHSKTNNISTDNIISSHLHRRLCLEVQIHPTEKNNKLHQILSNTHYLIKENDRNATDTTHAILSEPVNNSYDSLDFFSVSSNTSSLMYPSSPLTTTNNSSQRVFQSYQPNDNFYQTHMSIVESSHLIALNNDSNRSFIEPYERLLPYLNRSRNLQQYSTLAPTRHLSTSEQSVPTIQPFTNIIVEAHSSSDSNLIRHGPITIAVPSSPGHNLIKTQQNDRINDEKLLLLHLNSQYQTNSLTNLSLYYVSSFETTEMIAIALLGMNQIHHLTLVNFSVYSSQLETTLCTLCARSQLQSLHLTSISLKHGAIGFLLHLFQNQIDRNNTTIILKRLKLDAIKNFALGIHDIHLSDVEHAEFIQNSPLEQFVWREHQIQYIHMRLLYKLSFNIMPKLHRLELASIVECTSFDRFECCQAFFQNISNLHLRNFRIRPINLMRFFLTLNTQCILTVFHFEQMGLTWNNHQQSATIHNAFTSLILHASHLNELSLAYNNLNYNFIDWLCQMLLWYNINSETRNIPWWSIKTLNLTFNLITSESIRRLIDALKEYKNQWKIRHSPIQRIDILGNAVEMRDLSNFKKEFNLLGCDFVSYTVS